MPIRSRRVSLAGGFAQLCFSQAVRDIVNNSSRRAHPQTIEILADYVYVMRQSRLERFNFYFTGFLTQTQRQRLGLIDTPAVLEHHPQLMHMRVRSSMEDIRALPNPERDGLLLVLRDLYELRSLTFRSIEELPNGQLRILLNGRSQTGRAISFAVRPCPGGDCR